METTGSIIVILSLFAIYFAPPLMPHKHKDIECIFIINLFLGWTLIGWVLAFNWASEGQKRN